MIYNQTTHVPNVVFDKYLQDLTGSEIKILLIVIRQTIGWVHKATGKRKKRDRISISQFMKKTGLSKRIIAKAIQSLVEKQLVEASDFKGNTLQYPQARKGKS